MSAIGDILDYYGKRIVERVKEKIKEKGLVASGQLYQNILYDVKIFGTTYTLHLGFKKPSEDYAADVDKGRKPGEKPKFEAIYKWVKAKGIMPKGKFKDNLTAQTSIAYAIQKSIAKKGTIKRFGYKGSNFFSEAVTPQLLNDIRKDLSKALKKDVTVELFKDTKKRGFTSEG